MKEIYLDNAAGTPTDPRVIRAMAEAVKEAGNPSSFNEAGRRAAALLTDARKTVAGFLGARPDEIIFCASGSEANTLAVLGYAEALGAGWGRVITTPIEHPSVREPLRRLASRGWKIDEVAVTAEGFVRAEDIVASITPKTLLVSVMYANNEIGTIEPIARIGKLIGQWRRAHHSKLPLLHVDACQATPYLDMDVQRLSVDLLTLNGSKVHGPRGSGVLFVRRGVSLAPIVLGGSQEGGRRAGTENVAAAVGLATALRLRTLTSAARVAGLRDRAIRELVRILPDVRMNGPRVEGVLPSIISISIPGVSSENLLLELDRRGIRCGSGSACTAHSVEPSHMLKAIGTPRKYLDGVLRISLSRFTTRGEMDTLLRVLPAVVTRVRARGVAH